MSGSDHDLQKQRSRLVRLVHLRHLRLDPAKGDVAEKAWRPNEARTANKLEHATGKRLERAAGGSGGDWRVRQPHGGSGRTLYDDCSPAPHKHFDAQFENWTSSLRHHLEQKSGVDVVSVDLTDRDLSPAQIKRAVEVIETLPDNQRSRVKTICDKV